jgi:hypothetical protein
MIPESELMAQARRARSEDRLEDMQSILVNVVVQEPNNDEAWLLLAETIQDSEKKMECLEQARRIDPRNPATLRAIQALRAEISQAALGASPMAEPGETAEPVESQETASAPASSSEVVVEIPIQPDLAGPLLSYADTLAKSVMMSVEPAGTRALGLELVQVIEQAMRHDELRARRWAHSGGRDALVKYEKTLSVLITNLPQQDSQLPMLRQARQRALALLK